MTKSGTTLVAGDVVLVPFPYSDLSTLKQRPALIFRAPDVLGDVLTLPITSKSGWSGAVELRNEHLLSGTLAKDSWIRCDKFYTFNQSAILRVFGRLRPEMLDRVHKQVCVQLDCQA